VADPDLSALGRLLDDFETLRSAGHLDLRRTDLLSVAGYGRTELAHSQILLWLLDPRGAHGLGPRLIRDVLAAGWDDAVAARAGDAVTKREQAHVHTRADVVAEIGDLTVVIENKVDALEQATQCEDLFREWGSDALYLFLSAQGERPTSAKSDAARRAWRNLSYGALGRWLADHLSEAGGPGAPAVRDYVETLRQQFPLQDAFRVGREDGMKGPPEAPGEMGRFEGPDPFDTPRLRFFLEHRQALTEALRLEREFKGEFERSVQSLLVPIHEALLEEDPSILGRLLNWNARGAKHPMFWKPTWQLGSDVSPVTIGLAWDGSDPSGRSLYSGLFVHRFSAPDVDATLRERFEREPTGTWVPGLYPVAYRYVVFGGDWWRDIPQWRRALAEEVVAAWRQFVGLVDEALATDPRVERRG
jgi:hypothetical protein